jgi:hypothetical protein
MSSRISPTDFQNLVCSLNSGVKYTCRFRGETEEGLELKKSCNINLFVGTSFEINRTP